MTRAKKHDREGERRLKASRQREKKTPVIHVPPRDLGKQRPR
jgi:hypothetical protein